MIGELINDSFPVVGLLLGYGFGVRTRRLRKPKEKCPCRHGINFHDADGCHYIFWDRSGRPECPCCAYAGPGSAYVPEFAGGER